jgi:hypothetical protein
MGRKRTEFLEEGEVPASNLLIADHYRQRQQLGELSLTRGFAHGLQQLLLLLRLDHLWSTASPLLYASFIEKH